MKKLKISKTQLQKYIKEHDQLLDLFTKRIKYIVTKISEVCDFTIKEWFIEDTIILSNIIDTIQSNDSCGIAFNVCSTSRVYDTQIIYNGENHWLADGFPIEWLFDDFEQELINGRKLYKDKVKKEHDEKALLIKLEADKNAKAVKSALKKLSYEEKRVLGLIK